MKIRDILLWGSVLAAGTALAVVRVVAASAVKYAKRKTGRNVPADRI